MDVVQRSQTASRLPSYRRVDLRGITGGGTTQGTGVGVGLAEHGHSNGHSHPVEQEQEQLPNNSPNNTTASCASVLPSTTRSEVSHNITTKFMNSPPAHTRNHSTNNIATSDLSKALPALPRSRTFSCERDLKSTTNPAPSTTLDGLEAGNTTRPSDAETRKVPASNSRNDLGEKSYWNGPPPAMITQRSFPLETSTSATTSTTTQDWVASQSTNTEQPPPASPAHPKSSRSSTDNTTSRPVILPIRGFKSRRSVEMASKRISTNDPDSTLRALEGTDLQRSPGQQEHENNSDDSDLFLRAAREEELTQRTIIPESDRLIRYDKRRSQTGQRTSLPPTNSLFHNSVAPPRRGSDNEGTAESRLMEEHESIGQALSYRLPGRDRPSALDDLNRSRYFGGNTRSSPTTPRTYGSREISPESQASYGGRRGSIPDHNAQARTTSYRQSNLSYTAPRTYNSSPLVSRTTDMHMHDPPETPRAAEGTESTVSTTAPSTVWDELEELKSRIHRLELTGKMPATSGGAMSRASNERPPTATTTATTMSSSPKRGRNNSISPTEANAEPQSETHPLLTSALAKSKGLINPEIYKALEAAAADALAITAMMGSSGQPGPISSSQSTVGGAPVSDRQVRRKADSMCRSLTELCLALSEVKNEGSQTSTQVAVRPVSRDSDVRQSIEPNNNLRLGMSNDLARVKSSPRALSRLEARRSSLLTGSSLPSPRYNPSEAGTPTQSSMAGRRTSLLLRGSRRGTEEPEDDDEARFRAPSRANTEIGRVRNSPREYVSQQPLPERLPERFQERLPERSNSIQSSLPVRRHYTSSSLPNNGQSMPPVSSLGGRRYLDRSTPERDTTSVVGRIAEDRAQRKSSIGFPINRTASLNRKTRQPSSADFSAGQNAGYQ